MGAACGRRNSKDDQSILQGYIVLKHNITQTHLSISVKMVVASDISSKIYRESSSSHKHRLFLEVFCRESDTHGLTLVCCISLSLHRERERDEERENSQFCWPAGHLFCP